MQRSLFVLLATATFSLLPLNTILKAQSTCFMTGSNGQNINLEALCSNSPPSDVRPSRNSVIQIPIKRRLNGIPTVDLTFNGNKTFEMLFDTGASGITITKDMAEAIGIKAEREAYSQTAGGVVPVGLGIAQMVSAGGLTVKNIPVSINPSHSMNLGLLGQTFYKDHDVTIKEDVIELRPR